MPEWLSNKIVTAVAAREYPKTCCPSEIARALSVQELGQLECKDWREAMPIVRQEAWQLRQTDTLDITQKGEPIQAVSLDDIKGPIRLRVKATQSTQVE